jgi:ABC-type multidrug transport system fused ATPase/permease subunit
MSLSLNRESIALLYQFLGRRIVILASISVLVGFALFAVDMAMAVTIQAFFRILGLQAGEKIILDAWLPADNLFVVISLLLIAGTARGVTTWLMAYANGVMVVVFETRARRMVIGWALGTRGARVSEVTTLYNDRTISASNFITSTIGVFTRVIVAVLLAVSLINISLKITLLVAVSLALLVPLIRWLDRRISTASHMVHSQLSASVDRLLVGVQNSLLLHIYGTHRHEAEATRSHLTKYGHHYERYYFLSGLKGVLPIILGTWVISLITVASQSIDPMPAAVMISYFYLFLRFVQSMGELANLGSHLSLTRPRMIALWDWWRTNVANEAPLPQAAVTTADETPAFDPGGPVGWRLEGVTFSYPGSTEPVLDAVDLEITPGSTLVIVGPSGVGKSTLLAILLGLETPDAGRIFVTPHDHAPVPLGDAREQLLNHVGYVGPDSFIIAGTIRENLAYGTRESFDDTQINEALAMADCRFVADMPGGLDHTLTEQGEGLSAGQKQRLSLARALLRRPDILILDEATANLDNAAEQRMVETMNGLKGRMTIIAVTHREGLLEIADQIIQLEQQDGK